MESLETQAWETFRAIKFDFAKCRSNEINCYGTLLWIMFRCIHFCCVIRYPLDLTWPNYSIRKGMEKVDSFSFDKQAQPAE